jgi:SAM-dependent methyltransferase
MITTMDYFEAYEHALTPLATASSLLQLVARADEAGLMAALRTPASVIDAAAHTGLGTDTVAVLCRALVTLNVAESDGATIVLTAPWLALTEPGAFVPLPLALAGIEIDGRHLLVHACCGPDHVRQVDFVRSLLRSAGRGVPLRRDERPGPRRHGRRWAFAGTGLWRGGRILTTLRAMPQLTAVGVELSADLAAEARRRAQELGVADRFEVVCADAAEFDSAQSFDFAFWSQFFFPEAARPAALATLRRVSPGAVVDAPTGANFAAIDADPTGPQARDFVLWRTVLDSWGVPERRPEQLIAEFEAAGFEDVRAVERPGSPVIRARQP